MRSFPYERTVPAQPEGGVKHEALLAAALATESFHVYPPAMIRQDNRVRILATCLAALAGYVDALAFLHLGGFFVSFMSGNSTRLGVGLAEGSRHAAIAAALIGLFVTGVTIGSLLGRWAGPSHRMAVMLLVAGLLATAAMISSLGGSTGAVVPMALAMGAENAIFERDGEVQIGLTYMTGTLVKMGQRLAATITGGDRFGWAPYFLLWLGLAAGAVAGAAIYPLTGLNGLWIAAAAALLCVPGIRRLSA